MYKYSRASTPGSGGGGGGALFHTYMYVGSRHFLGLKFLNFNIFGVFKKK